jgi:hypothetical protein
VRIIPNGIKPHNEELVGRGECPHFDVADTIKITDAQWNEIGTNWVKEGGHKKWLVGVEGGKFHYEQVKPFSQYLNELIQLKREVGQ